MFKYPEQFGLLQLVLDSVKAAETIFTADVNGQQQVIAHIAPAPLYILLLLVMALIVKVVATMVGVFGNLGAALLRIAADLGRPSSASAVDFVSGHALSRASPNSSSSAN